MFFLSLLIFFSCSVDPVIKPEDQPTGYNDVTGTWIARWIANSNNYSLKWDLKHNDDTLICNLCEIEVIGFAEPNSDYYYKNMYNILKSDIINKNIILYFHHIPNPGHPLAMYFNYWKFEGQINQSFDTIACNAYYGVYRTPGGAIPQIPDTSHIEDYALQYDINTWNSEPMIFVRSQ